MLIFSVNSELYEWFNVWSFRMITKFDGNDRVNWRLPCFSTVQIVFLSDSQFRDVKFDGTRRKWFNFES